MPIQALLLDLDDTLVYLDRAVVKARVTSVCAQLAEAHGLDATVLQAEHEAVGVDVWEPTLTGSLTGIAAMHELWRRTLLACGCADLEVVAEAHQLYWLNRRGVICAFDDVTAMLAKLPPGLPKVVLTSGPADTQWDKLEILGIGSHFDLLVASGEVGAAKPDPAIFLYALERLALAPSRQI